MKELLKDILRQLLGLTKPREGKIVLTYRGTNEMYQNKLTTKIIEHTFRYGYEVKPGLIIKRYTNYRVGVYYKYDIAEEAYMITFIFKN